MKKKQQEAETMFKLTARLPQSLVANVKIRAIQRGMKLQEAINEALESWLKEDRK